MDDKKFRKKKEKAKWKKQKNSFDRRIKKSKRKETRRHLKMQLSSRINEELTQARHFIQNLSEIEVQESVAPKLHISEEEKDLDL